MLRLRRDALEVLEDKAYYGGGLFTGVAFDEKDGVVLGARAFQEGVDADGYSSPFEVPDGALRVTEDHPQMAGEPDMETVKFHGSPFEGVLYTFQGPYCVGEAWYAKGWSQIDIEYHPNGVMSSYEEYRNEKGGRFSFDPSGEMTEASIVKGPSDRLKLAFAPGGRLRTLDASGRVLSREEAVIDGLPFRCVSRTADLATVRAHEDLTLLGNGVRVEALTQLVANDGLLHTRSLELYKTPLGPDDLDVLKDLPLLERLTITDTGGELLPALTVLKALKPDLHIVCNKVPVAAPLEADPTA